MGNWIGQPGTTLVHKTRALHAKAVRQHTQCTNHASNRRLIHFSYTKLHVRIHKILHRLLTRHLNLFHSRSLAFGVYNMRWMVFRVPWCHENRKFHCFTVALSLFELSSFFRLFQWYFGAIAITLILSMSFCFSCFRFCSFCSFSFFCLNDIHIKLFSAYYDWHCF